MDRYSVQDAQNCLEELITNAHAGKTILIVTENNQVIQLVPVALPSEKRKAGSARGLIKLAPDFDSPLADFED
jgi:antitoxin (DNA-binding transcriptional repressor) of toxin-antitoxin stability system